MDRQLTPDETTVVEYLRMMNEGATVTQDQQIAATAALMRLPDTDLPIATDDRALLALAGVSIG